MIKYLICDIDGTLTNGNISYDIFGRDIKFFNVKDGTAIKFLIKNNVTVIFLSGRKSRVNKIRAKELGVKYLYQGIKNKSIFIKHFLFNKKINLADCAYIGDDINDYESMLLFPYRFCPNDAHYEIKKISTFKSNENGGEGVLVSITDYILQLNK